MLQHQNHEDINHKYAKSLIFHKGLPVLCQGAQVAVPEKGAAAAMCVVFSRIGPGALGINEFGLPNSPDFDDGPYRLGYINGVLTINEDAEQVKTCVFSSRIPIRRWKQGLNSENVHFQGNGLGFARALQMQEFVDMLTGKYPTFKQVVKLLGDEKIKRTAYHRHWALGLGKLEQVELFYRGQLVGQGDDHKKIKLAPKFAFLKEAFAISME